MTPSLVDHRAWYALNGQLMRRGVATIPAPAHFATQVLEEQFTGSILNAGRFVAYDASNGNATYGSPTRIQKYQAANVVVGTGSAGATGGTSARYITNETDNGTGTTPSGSSAGTRWDYTAGMTATKDAGFFLPLYLHAAQRVKICHGQGLWACPFWLTARIGGANTFEFDLNEYFHSEIPGRISSTLHATDNTNPADATGHLVANKHTNNGAAGNGTGGRTFFEAPTYTPGWHEWAVEIVPVTDATGNNLGDPTQPSQNVRFTTFLDGVQAWRVVDTTALWWTTHGGSIDSFHNVYSQGCQVDGDFVGHPRDTLGYSHWAPPIVNSGPKCLISGTPPSSCSITSGGYTIQRAQFDGVANVVEVDYMRAWKYTG